jgi:hypothetical protein
MTPSYRLFRLVCVISEHNLGAGGTVFVTMTSQGILPNESSTNTSLGFDSELARELGLVLRRVLHEEFASTLQTILSEIHELKASLHKAEPNLVLTANYKLQDHSAAKSVFASGQIVRNDSDSVPEFLCKEEILQKLQNPSPIGSDLMPNPPQEPVLIKKLSPSKASTPSTPNQDILNVRDHNDGIVVHRENRSVSLRKSSSFGLSHKGSLKSQGSRNRSRLNSSSFVATNDLLAIPPPAQEGSTMYGRHDVARKVPACGCGVGDGMTGKAVRTALEHVLGISDPNIWVGHPGSSLIHPSSPFSTGPHTPLAMRVSRAYLAGGASRSALLRTAPYIRRSPSSVGRARSPSPRPTVR